MESVAGSVDHYLAGVRSDVARDYLIHLRQIIRAEIPDVEESIKYGIRSYTKNGYLIGFAAFKKHCSLFPGHAVASFASQLTEYKISKGTIQFSPEKPLPDELIRTILRARVCDLAELKS